MEILNTLAVWAMLEVTWIDIKLSHGSYDPEEFMENYAPCIRKSLGYYLGTRGGHLFFSSTDDRAAGAGCTADEVNAVPLGVVQHIQAIAPLAGKPSKR